jgi:hypothetical protein
MEDVFPLPGAAVVSAAAAAVVVVVVDILGRFILIRLLGAEVVLVEEDVSRLIIMVG